MIFDPVVVASVGFEAIDRDESGVIIFQGCLKWWRHFVEIVLVFPVENGDLSRIVGPRPDRHGVGRRSPQNRSVSDANGGRFAILSDQSG